jgi:hypothetical protein
VAAGTGLPATIVTVSTIRTGLPALSTLSGVLAADGWL